VASAGKPFVYASLMERQRLDADSLLSNTGLSVEEAQGYSGLRYPHETEQLNEGVHPLWMGLAYSSNRMTVRAGIETGMRPWLKMLNETALIDGSLDNDTAMWLGSFAVRPVDLAAAYAVFPRGGEHIDPWLVEGVEIEGRRVFQRRSRRIRVMKKHTAGEVTAALREVLTVGTAANHGGRELARRMDVAGKTGTSDGVFDAWFVGYGSDVTVAVWLGFPEGNRTILEGGTGGRLAFPVWKAVIEGLPKEYDFGPIPMLGAGRRTLTMLQ
jgi:penicillin-binding protein 1A